jgi:hypothetical protein
MTTGVVFLGTVTSYSQNLLFQDPEIRICVVGSVPGHLRVLIIHVRLVIYPLGQALDSQLLCNNHGSFLPNDQRSRVRICSDIARADGQVCYFQSLDAVHIQARVNNATSRA